MAPSKSDGKRKFSDRNDSNVNEKNISNDCLWMRINSGTKIRNVLGHALKVSPQQYNYVIWTGAGQAISKVISCTELFKRKNPGLHQVTKLRYINNCKNDESAQKQIPEINIFLTKKPLDANDPIFQREYHVETFKNLSIDDDKSQVAKKKLAQNTVNIDTAKSSIVAEETMTGLGKSNKKRSQKYQTDNLPTSKRKNIENEIPQGL